MSGERKVTAGDQSMAGDQILRWPDLRRKIRADRSTIYRWWAKERSFPAQIRLGPRAIGWRLREIEAWLAARPSKAATDSEVRTD
jgi:prophage regulatory protein